ncbi:DUF58 domain-containing protein [Cellulosimicrobium marinum]|uniref:DUF58 domain-containing protein n=1 Tax=Cellulosimicrobium marinum TaxID=1638992 RepID=UPI001E538A15|nr:DUF58 domain-containing protein [Cellulosimicrobium marinum]MCB7137774.1 DUF58 domain-containing protein [Cellulosimicrobium marinum]
MPARPVPVRRRSLARRLTRARPTRRGTGLLVTGGVLAAVGITLGLPDVVGLGAAAVLVVVSAWCWMTAHRIDRGRGALRVARRVQPNPATRGQVTTARLTVSGSRRSAGTAGTLARLRISEQAAHELCDHGSLRAQVVTREDHIAVRYRLRPLRRGRWPLGPLLTTRVDAFGLVSATQELGDATSVAVWPRTVELPVRGTRAFGEQERSTTGARLSSSDDSVLRDYVAGDDPRRVHWASAARHGQLMVRADESASLPPVSVLLDRGLLPHPGLDHPGAHALADGEWAVEAAASVGVSLLQAGHPVRLVPTSLAPVLDTTGFTTNRAGEGPADVLDATVDLQGHHGLSETDRAAAATAEALRAARRPGEVTFALLGPLGPVARSTVASMAGDTLHWAMVVRPRTTSSQQAEAQDTVAALRATGWHVVLVDADTPLDRAWTRLVEGSR